MNRNTKQLRAAERKKAVAFSKVCKALADESRVKIVLMLSTGATNACDFTDALHLSQPTLSHHLKVLLEADVVEYTKEGKWRIYSLTASGQDLAAYILNG